MKKAKFVRLGFCELNNAKYQSRTNTAYPDENRG